MALFTVHGGQCTIRAQRGKRSRNNTDAAQVLVQYWYWFIVTCMFAVKGTDVAERGGDSCWHGSDAAAPKSSEDARANVSSGNDSFSYGATG